jgi:homocysteine S-methyltransferase
MSWQATLQGFQSRGLSREQSEALLRRSVQIAQEARAIFLEGRSKGPYAARENMDGGSTERRPVLVAASVGSYGAYLADGSEYTYVSDSVGYIICSVCSSTSLAT